MSRIALVITVDSEDADRVEHQVDAVLREYRYKLQRFELEDGDELLKLSVAKDAITAGLGAMVKTMLDRATPEALYAAQLAKEMSEYEAPPDDTPEEIATPSAFHAYRLQREEKRAAELAERNTRAQEESRRRFEELDLAADEARRQRQGAKAESGCPGGCSRGGEGPPCGRPGCY